MVMKTMKQSFLYVLLILSVIICAVSLVLFCGSGALSAVSASSAPPFPIEEEKGDVTTNMKNCFIPAESISLENTKYIRVIPGGTFNVEIKAEPENCNEKISWYSTNPAVATISETGVIEGVSKGDAFIVAETSDGKIQRRALVMVSKMPSKILDAPYINQLRDYPNGCESCSTVMALQHVGIDIDTETFIENYLDMSPLPYVNKDGVYVGASPWEYFLGDPRLSTGLCCYAPAIVNALEKFVDPEEYTVTLHNGVPLEDLCRDYISKGVPIIFWGTMYMKEPYLMDWTWTIDGSETGEKFTWVAPMHCLLLVGYDEAFYYFNDPVAGKGVAYKKAACEAAYKGLYEQAVTVVPVTDAEE